MAASLASKSLLSQDMTARSACLHERLVSRDVDTQHIAQETRQGVKDVSKAMPGFPGLLLRHAEQAGQAVLSLSRQALCYICRQVLHASSALALPPALKQLIAILVCAKQGPHRQHNICSEEVTPIEERLSPSQWGSPGRQWREARCRCGR